VLLAVLVLLVAVFVVVDRIALGVAENQAASALQDSQHLSEKPDVSIAGFPFLTQLAASEFDDVTIAARNVEVGSGLTIAGVTVHLHHVTVSDSYRTVQATSATAQAKISYAELSRVLGAPVRAAGAGRLVAEPSVTIAGRKLTGKVTAVVHASSGQGITFTGPVVVGIGMTLADAPKQAVAAIFAKPISLAGLPFSIQVDSVDVTTSALVLRLSGLDLVYSR
jgi:hypothetical protein